MKLNRVGVFSNQQLPRSVIEEVAEWFAAKRVEPVILNEEWSGEPKLDLVVTIGGDGTVLAGLIHFPDCPVLAINFGTVGFLTAGNREELDIIMQQLLEDDYVISERSVLECVHPYGTDYAVNEIVIKGATRLINMELTINGQPIRTIRGDGFIVGTATGSTAYLLAAGSPIVMPELHCMILSGLNEYDFRARHLVVTHDSKIELHLLPNTREKEIYLSADGKEKVPLSINDRVQIHESNRRARLVFMEPDYFFQNLSSRLSWFQRSEA